MRENTDQKNSVFEHFLRGVRIELGDVIQRKTIEKY